MYFSWIPGSGICPDALSRLQSNAVTPEVPLGEAWFMSAEREMYTELDGDLSSLDIDYLQKVLEELSSGSFCFPDRREWVEWHDYLLPYLIPRCHESYTNPLIEDLCTAFMCCNPADDLDELYPGYRCDVLNSLGRSLMNADLWQDGHIRRGRVLHRSRSYRSKRWGWAWTSGDLACSMIFCIKYLRAEEIDAWVRSIFDIPCPYWRSQIIVWLMGADRVFTREWRFPSQYNDDEEGVIRGETDPLSILWINWSGSHLVSEPIGGARVEEAFLPLENLLAFRRSVADCLARADFGEWKRSIPAIECLREEAAGRLSLFEEQHLQRLSCSIQG